MYVFLAICGIILVVFPFAVVAVPQSWGFATGAALRRLFVRGGAKN